MPRATPQAAAFFRLTTRESPLLQCKRFIASTPNTLSSTKLDATGVKKFKLYLCIQNYTLLAKNPLYLY